MKLIQQCQGVLVSVTLILGLGLWALVGKSSRSDVMQVAPDEPPDFISAIEQRISKDFDAELRMLERDAGTTSSFQIYQTTGFGIHKSCDTAKINAALDWLIRNDWADGSTTATLIRQVIDKNSQFFKLLKRGAELDAPLWPAGFDFNTPVPNFDLVRCCGRLALARARFMAERDPQRAVQEAMQVMVWGRHQQVRNQPLVNALMGLYLQRQTADFLLWLVSQQKGGFPDCGELARRLERERQGRAPMLDHCLQDLADYRKLMIAECGEVLRAVRQNPELMAPLRRRLARMPGLEAQSWPDRQVLDYLSTVTLQRRYDDLTSLTQACGRLTVVERLKRIDLIDRFWSKDLWRMTPLVAGPGHTGEPFLIFTAFLHDANTEADLRFLVTTLALQHGSRGGTLPTPQGALKALGISEEAGIDPFTDEPFQVKRVAPDRVELLGVPLPLRKELAIDHYRIERTSKDHPQPYSFPIAPVK